MAREAGRYAHRITLAHRRVNSLERGFIDEWAIIPVPPIIVLGDYRPLPLLAPAIRCARLDLVRYGQVVLGLPVG
jgi:hypothetical protein